MIGIPELSALLQKPALLCLLLDHRQTDRPTNRHTNASNLLVYQRVLFRAENCTCLSLLRTY